MKTGHKSNHHRMAKKDGGESAAAGDKDWEEDEKEKPSDYTAKNKVAEEAEEKNRGGKAMKKKHVGKMTGGSVKTNLGRKPRKSGGRAGSDKSPFSSARSGTPAKGHSTPGSTD